MLDLTTAKVTDTIVEAVKNLGIFADTLDRTALSRCRNLIRKLSMHEVCGVSESPECEHRCMELSLPLWDVTLYVQRALTLDCVDEE